MTAIYNRSGLHFMYPENWELAEDSVDTVPRSILLQAPSGAFWSLDIHPFSVSDEELLQHVVEAMRGEYPDLEAQPADEQIAGESASGYNLFFYCLDFIVAARVRALRLGHATYLWMYQAEDRDFDQLEPVFRAITVSMFRDP
jgi:hypothetical protein